MTNLTHNSFLCIYFNSLHVSSNLVLIIRRINCIYTTSGVSHCVGDRFVCSSPTCVRNGHRHRETYTRCCIDTIDSPDDEHEVARNMQIIEINTQKRIVCQVGHLPSYTWKSSWDNRKFLISISVLSRKGITISRNLGKPQVAIH